MIVAFDPVFFAARYPELAGIPFGQLPLFFAEAGLYCNNTLTSPVSDDSVGGQRYLFLHMLTAHIAALNASVGGNESSPLVGRINMAVEGTVQVQTQNEYPSGSPQWFQQTKYGAAFWGASAAYRTMLYVPGNPRPVRW